MRSSILALALLATSAVASAQPPHAAKPASPVRPQRWEPATLPLAWIDGAPRTIAPVLSPPGLTPTIREVECADDPYETLRTDCRERDDAWQATDESTDSRVISDPDHGRAMRSDQSAGRSTAGDWRETHYLR